MTLHTHKEIEHLKKLGVSPELAEAIVELHTKSDEHLVTKSDLNTATVALKSELNTATVALKSEIHESKSDLKLELVKIEGEIKALSNSKWFDRSLAIAILGFFITSYIKPVGTAVVSLIQYFS
jgi:hypothetical protein